MEDTLKRLLKEADQQCVCYEIYLGPDSGSWLRDFDTEEEARDYLEYTRRADGTPTIHSIEKTYFHKTKNGDIYETDSDKAARETVWPKDGDDSDEVKEEENSEFEKIASKEVYDSDGFTTEYTLYYNHNTGEYLTIFGDSDLYTPENTSPDAEFDTKEEAEEWFDNYEGFEGSEENESLETSDSIRKDTLESLLYGDK